MCHASLGVTISCYRFGHLKTVRFYLRCCTVCVSVQASTGPMLIYGTIIPYAGAGTKYRYRSNGTDQVNQTSWQLHYAAIARLKHDWIRIRECFPEHGFCAGGDFNQTRDGRKTYGTMMGRKQLTNVLKASCLSCVTEDDFVATGMLSNKSVIDHLCLDRVLASKVQVVQPWEANRIDGKPISDHGGVFVDIKDPS
jgi:hypothetical protein